MVSHRVCMARMEWAADPNNIPRRRCMDPRLPRHLMLTENKIIRRSIISEVGCNTSPAETLYILVRRQFPRSTPKINWRSGQKKQNPSSCRRKTKTMAAKPPLLRPWGPKECAVLTLIFVVSAVITVAVVTGIYFLATFLDRQFPDTCSRWPSRASLAWTSRGTSTC